MNVTTFEAKCNRCKTIFEHPSLGDFVYGSFIFTTEDGSDHLYCNAIKASEFLDVILGKKLNPDSFPKLLLDLVDNPFGKKLTLSIPCPHCFSTKLEYWEGDKRGSKTITQTTFKDFENLPKKEQIERLKNL